MAVHHLIRPFHPGGGIPRLAGRMPELHDCLVCRWLALRLRLCRRIHLRSDHQMAASTCTVLRFLLVPLGLVSGHLEYVPPVDDGDTILMMYDSNPNEWDARMYLQVPTSTYKYYKCRPFGGQKGVPFEKWVRDFGAAVSVHADQDSDLEQTMLGEDVGGDVAIAVAAAAAASSGGGRCGTAGGTERC